MVDETFPQLRSAQEQLYAAAKSDWMEGLLDALARGADINAKDKSKMTALAGALIYDCPNALVELLNRGALHDKNSRSWAGALGLAALKESRRSLAALEYWELSQCTKDAKPGDKDDSTPAARRRL